MTSVASTRLPVVFQLLGQPGIEHVLDETGGGDEAGLRFRAQRVGQEQVTVVGEAAVVAAGSADVEPDGGGIIALHQRSKPGSGVLDAAGVAGRRKRLEEAAIVLRGAPVVGVGREPVLAGIHEHHDIAPARVAQGRGDELGDRVGVEFLAHHDPHLDSVFTHLFEQQGPFAGEPVEADFVLGAHAQELGHPGDDAAVEEFDGLGGHGWTFAGGAGVGGLFRRGAGRDQGRDHSQ